jgi:hypothetical protein
VLVNRRLHVGMVVDEARCDDQIRNVLQFVSYGVLTSDTERPNMCD